MSDAVLLLWLFLFSVLVIGGLSYATIVWTWYEFSILYGVLFVYMQIVMVVKCIILQKKKEYKND